jgi:toxin-antitoxin system PIN domain toxin
MTTLLDANLLIALVVDHVHHDAERWFAAQEGAFATCPITEGSLVRLLIRQGQSGATARAILTALAAHPRHEFRADSVSYRDVPLDGVVGHRQVTDAYLVQLARAHQARLASVDRGLAALHGDLVELIPAA